MPELPEVETVRRSIAPILEGRRVLSVEFQRRTLRYRIPVDKVRAIAASGPVRAVSRLGKYLRVEFPGGDWVLHLGMSGNIHASPITGPHVHVRITTAAGTLHFEDPRRFGLMDAVAAGEPNKHLDRFGPDAWLACPDGAALFTATRKRQVAIKNLLMNQAVLAGIGNIYASEILHRAGISPRRKASRLRRKECSALAAAIPAILNEAIANCGTTFDSFRTPEGQAGGHYASLAVYEKAGLPCPRCGSPIRRITQTGRSTYFCGGCQA